MLTEIYLDHDLDVITIVSIDTYLAQVNSDYNENSETVSLSVYDAFSPRTKLVDLEDVPGIVDLKKDQWVLVNWADESTAEVNKRVVVISEPEILSDVKATQFSRSEDENKGNYNDDPTGERVTSIVVDGTEYKNNRQAYYEEGTLYDYQQDYLVNKTYDLYLDAYGNFIGASLHSGADQYVFIAGYDRPQSSIGVRTADAAAIFPDGSMEVIKVNVKNTNDNIEDYLEDNRTANYANTSDTPLSCKPINTTNIAKLDARWDNNAWKYWSWSENDGVAGQYQENMWYSYTEVDGVYTLTPAKGWTLDVNTASDPTEIVINCSNVRLTHDGDTDGFHMGTGRSYSEDESAFITVELGDTDAGTDTGVTEVTGTYTGIQNVNLVYKTNQWVNAVYNAKNGYIVAAIVLGEAEGVVDNYAFIRSGVFNEKYDEATKTHYWDFKCILNGELVTKTIKSKFDNTVSILTPGTVQELVLDADGYVVRIKDLDDTDPGSNDEIYNNYDYINNTNTTGNDTINLDDYDAYDIVINSGFPNATNTGVNFQMGDAYCIDLALQNNTLHYDRDVKDVGLHFVKDAKAVVRQYVNNDWTWQSYSSVAQAFNTLTDADNNTANNATNLKQFNGRIVAVLNSRGEAEWVFFWDYTRANTITNGYSVTFVGATSSDLGKVDISANPITGIAKGESVTFTVSAKDGCKVEKVRIQGGSVLTPNANGVYTLANINGNRVVEITASGKPTVAVEPVTIELELGRGIASVTDVADSKRYVSGKKFVGEQGDALILTPNLMPGPATDVVALFYPDNDPTNPVVITPVSSNYTVPFNVDGKMFFEKSPAQIQFNELKTAVEGLKFDLWTEVVSGSHIIYYSNADGDSRDDAWSTRNPYTNDTANGRQVWFNNDVELAALTSFINEKISDTNYVSGTDIAVIPTGWGNRVGPTMIGSAEEYTRVVVVFGKDASGAVDTSRELGRVTVTYRINEISNNARTPGTP